MSSVVEFPTAILQALKLPVIVRYPHVHFDQSWGNIALGKLMFRMFIVSQFRGGQCISSMVLDCCSVLIGYYNCTNISFLWGHHAACKSYRVQTGLFRHPWGMYFSAKDKGEMMSMIYNWPGHLMVNKARLCSSLPLTYHGYMASSVLLVVMIVLTDGSRILGLGDLGVQGIGTPIGKVDMYVAAAGINPQRYLGLRQPQLEGEEHLPIVDEFMEAIHARWPKAIVQVYFFQKYDILFDDFQMKWAFERLQRYQKRFCMFNDDMQGTAGVALAGLLGTIRALGRPLTDFVNQKIVVVGAGSAGLGVFNMAAQAVSRMAGAEARSHYKARKGVDPAAAPFAKAPGEIEGLGLREGANLVEVMELSTTMAACILFLSLVKCLSSLINQVLEATRESDSPKPSIFAMSNPTMNAKCTAVDAFNHAEENIVFPSGSPFKNVDLVLSKPIIYLLSRNGKVGHLNQANNMYLFPGIGMGVLLSSACLISDEMSEATSECIQDIAAEVRAAVVLAAVVEELAEGRCDVGTRELRGGEYVKRNMWYPVYSPLVHEK
ncbi:unnamed protein product [Camellia sinensis]